MKLRYPIIICIILHLLVIISDYMGPHRLYFLLQDIEGFAIIITLLYAIYVFIKYIFRTIKGSATEVPQSGDYRSEARRACEKITPKKAKQDTFSFKD